MQKNETATSTVLLNGEQAKRELTVIESKVESLRAKLKEANDAGDGEAFKKLSKELRSAQKEMKQMAKDSFDLKKVLDNLSGASMPDLKKAKKELDKQLNSPAIVRGSKAWKELTASLTSVKNELKSVNDESKIGETTTSKLANGFNKYFSMLTTGIAALTGIVFGAKEIIKSNAELSDSFADVMKTTNLTRAEVESLYSQFKDMNTRTPRKELLQLASDAGKLGIDGKQNIMDFVDAANQIKIALGEDLGEDAIKSIGKMVSVYSSSTKEIQDKDLKGQMLAIGSAVNSIGQNSSASEDYLVQFAGRLGGVAKQAGIGADAILGYASALDQDMQQVEMSATALQNFIMKVMGEPAKFAKLAGIPVKEFVSLLNTDANAAIKKVLLALNDKGGFSALIPLFKDMGLDGARAVGVLSALAGSMDKVDAAQKLASQSLISGTSITKEYNIRNSNLAATLEKLSQNIKGWFTNSAFVSFLTGMVSSLEELTKSAKSATKEYEETNKSVLNLKMNIEPLLSRYDELAKKTNKSAAENAEMKRIISEVTDVMPGATTAVDKYGNSIAISTGRVREFINAEVARLGVVNRKAIEENRKFLEKTERDLANTKANIDEITKTGTFKVTDVTITPSGGTAVHPRNAYADEITAEQNKYKQLIQDKKGYESEIERLSGASLQKQIDASEKARKQKQAEAEREREYWKKSKSELLALIKNNDELAKKVYAAKFPVIPADPEGDKKALKHAEEVVEKWKLVQQAILKEKRLKNTDGIDTEERYQLRLQNIEIEYLGKKQKLYKKGSKEALEIAVQIDDIRLKMQEELRKRREQEDKLSLESFKHSHEAELNIAIANDLIRRNQLEKELYDGTITQEEYDEEIIKLDVQTAYERLQIANNYAEDVANFHFDTEEDRVNTIKSANDAALDADRAYQLAKRKLTKDGLAEVVEIEKRYGVNSAKEKREEYKKDLALLKEELKNKEITLERYNQDVSVIQKKIAEDKAQDIVNVANAASDLSKKLQESEVLAVENKYAAQLKAAKAAGKSTTALEEQIEEEKKEIKKKYADIDFAISIGQIIANTALAIMKSAPNVPLQVLEGVMGAAQLGIAIQQREATKNLWTGGFTEPGDKYKPAGIVHAGEFVANQDAVKSPPLRRVFNLIDYAQKTNSVARISNDDIARAVGIRKSFSEGGYGSTVSQSSTTVNGISKEDLAWAISVAMSETNSVNTQLLNQLRAGIVAKYKISGNDGVVAGIKEYETLLKNAGKNDPIFDKQ